MGDFPGGDAGGLLGESEPTQELAPMVGVAFDDVLTQVGVKHGIDSLQKPLQLRVVV